MTQADQILSFQKNLRLNVKLPKGVQLMNPYREKRTQLICEQFYKRFYNDNLERRLILGINPGRYGGGITGIPFTDPVKLETLGIHNDLQKRRELSSDFVYQVIEAFGGVDKFYREFYISAVSPLGFTKKEKNLNYYDVKGLPGLLDLYIVKCMREQLAWGLTRKVCFCFGEGENYKFLRKINDRHLFFDEIRPLPHPRFIMQYRRKRIGEYIDLYVKALR